MSDLLYRLLRILGAPFRYRVIGREYLVDGVPAIYVANHLGSVGPVRAILSLPLRLYPWVVAEMTDPRRAPQYLYDDFIHPTWHLSGRLGRVVAAVVARVAVALINGIDCVAVERSRGPFDVSMEQSLELLCAGKSLLIFPEDPDQALDPGAQMRPFRCGFMWLCHTYEQSTGHPLSLYPVTVYPPRRMILIGPPRRWEPSNERSQSLRDLCHRLQMEIGALYCALEDDHKFRGIRM